MRIIVTKGSNTNPRWYTMNKIKYIVNVSQMIKCKIKGKVEMNLERYLYLYAK